MNDIVRYTILYQYYIKAVINLCVNYTTPVCNSVTMCVFVLRVLTCCGFRCFLCVCVIIGLCACVGSLDKS